MNRRLSLPSTLETNIKIGSFDSLAIAKQLCLQWNLGTPIIQHIDEVIVLKRGQVSDPQNRKLDAEIRTRIETIREMACTLLSGPA
ncbi:hypothetical protein EBR57_04975 [bacterium]|nr:hypothetical protein [bacterium]